MAKINPFKGLLYNREKVEISKVVAPPYDVVSEAERDYLYSLSEHNVIRLILNKSRFPYLEAGKIFNSWIRNGILLQDSEDSIYLYTQKFSYRGKKYTRYGFISLLKLEELGNKILPHERTNAGPKQDRLRLLFEVKANLSPIFVLFSDSSNSLPNLLNRFERFPPIFKFHFQEMLHTFWRISEKEIIQELKNLISRKSILIADGHHRYEVALAYQKAMQEALSSKVEGEMPYDYVMSYFAPKEQEGLLVLPTHRLVNLSCSEEEFCRQLNSFFEVYRFDSRNELFGRLDESNKFCLGTYFDGKYYLLNLKPEVRSKICNQPDPIARLNISLLHNLILEEIFHYRGEISYTQDEMEAIKLVDQKKYKVAFLLNPMPVKVIIELARRNLLMPQKSTYFYPKILTGLVFYKF